LAGADGNTMTNKTPDSPKPVPTFTAAYHSRQWEVCYDSSRAFFEFLSETGAVPAKSDQHIVDLCTGSGANLYWLLKGNPALKLTGAEIDPELVAYGNGRFAEEGMADAAKLITADVYDLPLADLTPTDGVIALQTVSWLPDEVGFIDACVSLEPNWIALTGLMIEGGHTYRTVINDHGNPDKGVNFYNTFSLDHLRELFDERGYMIDTVKPFEIGIDLAKPATPGPGTYTEKTVDGRRLQISGALLMNWHFLLARRA